MEDYAADVRCHTLILDDATVADQQDLVQVLVSRRQLPLSLQAVCAVEVKNLQPADWSWYCEDRWRQIVKNVTIYLIIHLSHSLFTTVTVSDLLVHAVSESELLRLPLLVVTIMV